jgi:hypothetical protein
MANTFRKRQDEDTQPIKVKPVQKEEQPKAMPNPRVNPPQRTPKRTVRNKKLSKGIKTVRKGFEGIFGGRILQKINIRKNWAFILMVVVMVIVLIYSNLSIQSKRETINNLIQEIIIAKDEAMDAIEEGYNIDKQKERELLTEGEQKGFVSSGYIPYIIEAE